ncbi:glycine cleavage system protein GcvH [Candidatus Acetothermia bacterium]|nr:glycine cleavage system protein GcvH [Candidatus Acetothermia bacterium]MBI3459320.1 glycine cleavage system protein GcvH [Candidatus Acetothermia bacterium]
MPYPSEYRYSKEHEWVKLEGANARMGITDFAQHELGDVVYVELPKVGRKVKQHESFAVVESVKAASEVYAPVSGEVIEVNKKLENQPELINKSPHTEGWMVVLRIDTPKELDNLLTAADYEKHIGGK